MTEHLTFRSRGAIFPITGKCFSLEKKYTLFNFVQYFIFNLMKDVLLKTT